MDLDDLKREADAAAASDEPLHRLAAAVEVSRRVQALGDELLDFYVDAARSSGCTWAQVGDVLGVTRQAAQQRQKGWWGRLGEKVTGGKAGSGLFARFTDRARQAVAAAEAIARELGHNYVGTEHVLLGLFRLDDQAVAIEALRRLGVTRQAIEDEVAKRIPEGGPSPAGHIPFTPRSKKALELALREALQLGHNYIGTEHLLLGLTYDGIAADALTELGAGRDDLRREIVSILTAQRPDAGGTDEG